MRTFERMGVIGPAPNDPSPVGIDANELDPTKMPYSPDMIQLMPSKIRRAVVVVAVVVVVVAVVAVVVGAVGGASVVADAAAFVVTVVPVPLILMIDSSTMTAAGGLGSLELLASTIVKELMLVCPGESRKVS